MNWVQMSHLLSACLLSPAILSRNHWFFHVNARFVAVQKESQFHLCAASLSRNNCFFTQFSANPRCVIPSSGVYKAVFFYSDSCSTVTAVATVKLWQQMSYFLNVNCRYLVMLFNEIKVSAGIEECSLL
jgi:hypothetical protein